MSVCVSARTSGHIVQETFPDAGACEMIRAVRKGRRGFQVETTWDDETGNAEIREFDAAGALVRRCDWIIWPDGKRRDGQIGEAVWFDALGAEVERRPLREPA